MFHRANVRLKVHSWFAVVREKMLLILEAAMATASPQPISSSLLGDVLAKQAAQYPDKDALVYPELGLRWTFRQLEELAQTCARGLASMGIRKGERVALWSTNLPEWVGLFFGLR